MMSVWFWFIDKSKIKWFFAFQFVR